MPAFMYNQISNWETRRQSSAARQFKTVESDRAFVVMRSLIAKYSHVAVMSMKVSVETLR